MSSAYRFGPTVAVLSTFALCVGCSVDTDDVPEEVNNTSYEIAESNGRDLNGRDLNGRDLNGRDLNGRDLNGRDLNGTDLGGVELKANKLVAYKKNGQPLTQAQLVGAEIDGELIDGTPITLRIDDVDTQPSALGSGQLYLYTISDLRDNNQWGPLCGEVNGVPTRAMVLKGRWNYDEGVPGGGSKINDKDAVTFACAGFALYKCAEIGYEPWRKYHNKDLGNHHQACTRMLRADYCGDGKAGTQNGILINVYDKLGIQSDTDAWTFEAEWTPNGASCVKHQRLDGAEYAPTCGFQITASKCGNPIHWNSGTLIATEH